MVTFFQAQTKRRFALLAARKTLLKELVHAVLLKEVVFAARVRLGRRVTILNTKGVAGSASRVAAEIARLYKTKLV